MIYVVATIQAKPGTVDKLLAVAQPNLEGTRKEKGCISYDFHVKTDDPNTIVVVERWESRDNLTSHMQQPHFLKWRADGADFIAGRKIEIIDPANVEVR